MDANICHSLDVPAAPTHSRDDHKHTDCGDGEDLHGMSGREYRVPRTGQRRRRRRARLPVDVAIDRRDRTEPHVDEGRDAQPYEQQCGQHHDKPGAHSRSAPLQLQTQPDEYQCSAEHSEAPGRDRRTERGQSRRCVRQVGPSRHEIDARTTGKADWKVLSPASRRTGSSTKRLCSRTRHHASSARTRSAGHIRVRRSSPPVSLSTSTRNRRKSRGLRRAGVVMTRSCAPICRGVDADQPPTNRGDIRVSRAGLWQQARANPLGQLGPTLFQWSEDKTTREDLYPGRLSQGSVEANL